MKTIEEKRAKQREYMRRYYDSHPEFRAKQREYKRRRYQSIK
jgi:hypothetical protein